ncbi:ribonuclease P protein component [Geovibrio ferrireducens]|uniref:ribonuclease P protein component n=1 Tax=Geovibrio ferrireducens TaxID=46201 RepID=UPI002248578E|nr:ribonuclease P protein component [Geovibrio ferrireducens]
MNQRLKTSERLKKKSDYLKVLRGKKCAGRLITVYWNACDCEQSRFGFITGKKVSKKAVDRNRLRRYFKEFCRKNKGLFPAKKDFVFRALPGAGKASHDEIDNEAHRLMAKIASEISADRTD